MAHVSKELEDELALDRVIEIMKKKTNPTPEKKKKRGFVIAPKRWIVERSFA